MSPRTLSTGSASADSLTSRRRLDAAIALAMVAAGIWLLAGCEQSPSPLGKMVSGPSATVYFNASALPDTRSGPVQTYEAQYGGKTYRGNLRRSGSSWTATLGGVSMGTAQGLEVRIMAGGQMVYQAYQSNVRFSSSGQSVQMNDCNVRPGWSGTLHQNSCQWQVR